MFRTIIDWNPPTKQPDNHDDMLLLLIYNKDNPRYYVEYGKYEEGCWRLISWTLSKSDEIVGWIYDEEISLRTYK